MSLTTLSILLLLAVAIALIYNRLIRDRNRVGAAWSDIDVHLQLRHDLVPQLVKAVDQYAGYERATLEAVTNLRAQAMQMKDVSDLGDAEEALGEGVQRLLAVAEQYPDLKANENFLSLQTELSEIEDYLQFARRYYNGSVREYNTRTETVPNNIVARLFGFTQKRFFQESSDEAANVPLVDLGEVE